MGPLSGSRVLMANLTPNRRRAQRRVTSWRVWSSELSDAAEAELLPDLFRRVGSAYSESTREGPEICDELRETRLGKKYV